MYMYFLYNCVLFIILIAITLFPLKKKLFRWQDSNLESLTYKSRILRLGHIFLSYSVANF